MQLNTAIQMNNLIMWQMIMCDREFKQIQFIVAVDLV